MENGSQFSNNMFQYFYLDFTAVILGGTITYLFFVPNGTFFFIRMNEYLPQNIPIHFFRLT